MPTLTYALECQGGPCDGQTIQLRPGQAAYARRELSGVWHQYLLRSDDLGMILAYRGPIFVERTEPMDLPHEVE